jgi:acyl-CoA thioester hydrolase
MGQPALGVDRLEESRRHVHEFQVRFGDIDVLGHVNNCRYLTYLEDARIAMFRLDPMREGREPLNGLVVARHEIDYKRPLLFGPDTVRVETWVTGLRAASFSLAYEIRDDQHLYARASSVIVAYDLANIRARRLTDDELAFLKEHTT